MALKKEILENYGYATHALTNGEGRIYGINKNCYISDLCWQEMIDAGESFYWSDVYVSGAVSVIIRKGMALVANKTPKKLNELFEQSKINLND